MSEQGIVFGVSYSSAAIVPDGSSPPIVKNPVTDYVPNARPGARAPHVWLDADGERLSILDLFGEQWVLLAGETGEDWREAVDRVNELLGLPIGYRRIGATGELQDPKQAWGTSYGVSDGGAVLIRPDGHVAWRAPAGVRDPVAELTDVLTRVLARGVRTS
jgi:putative polyketide hydroxylase